MSGDSSANGSLPVFQLSLLLVFFGLLVGVATRYIQEKVSLPIPYTALVLISGIILAGIPPSKLGNLGESVNLINNIDPHLLLGGFIPALIFESAFGTNYHIVAREFTQAIILAGPGVLLNTFLSAIFLYFVFPYSWNWAQLILFGSMVSATDPVAVVALLRDLGASKRLATLIEGESLLNDGTSFVLYMISLNFVKGDNLSVNEVIFSFFKLTFISVFIGLLFGILVSFWLKNVFNDPKIEISITIFTCYLTFHLTEVEFKSSGVLSCVFLGLFLSKYKTYISPSVEESLHHFWEIFSYFSNTLIFLFSGIIIVKGIKFENITFFDVIYLFLLYIILHITRAITMLILWYPISNRGYGITLKEMIIMIFSGLRGVIGLALALLTRLEDLSKSYNNDESHEKENKFKDRVMFHVCGIVFLTLIINATSMKYIVKRLGLDKIKPQELDILKDAIKHLSSQTRQEMRSLKDVYIYAGADWEEVLSCLPNYSTIINDDINFKKPTKRNTTVPYYKNGKLIKKKSVLNNKNTRLKQCNKAFKILCDYLSCNDSSNNKSDISDIELETLKVDSSLNSSPSRSRRISKHFVNKFNASKFNLNRFGLSSEKSIIEPHDMKEEEIDDEKNNSGNTKTHVKQRKSNSLQRSNSLILDENHRNPSLLHTLSHIDKDIEIQDLYGNKIDDNEKRRQFAHRILSVMKSAYRSTFEEGSITQQANMILMSAAETALDYDDLNIHFEKIQSVFQIPWWLIQWYETNILKRLSRHLLFQKLSLAVEVGTVYISSTKTVNNVLNNISILNDNIICKEAINLLDLQSKEIREEWLGIQRSYPEVYRAIQTRHAAQHMIHHEAHKISELSNEGILEDNEYKKMMRKLLETQHNLRNKSFVNVTLTEKDQKSILLNLEFMSKIPNKEILKQILSCDKKLKQRNEKIYSAGHKALGAIVIARGTAELRIEGIHKDTYAPGSFLSWEYLCNENYLGDLIAQSTVEYFFITDNIMKSIMSYIECEKIIWQMCGINLLCAHFRDSFENFTRLELSKMCHLSTFIKTKDNEQKRLVVHTLLIKGEAMYPAMDYPTFRAPMVLLPSPQIPYTFDENSVLLQFFINPARFNTRRIVNPNSTSHRNRDNIAKFRNNSTSSKLMIKNRINNSTNTNNISQVSNNNNNTLTLPNNTNNTMNSNINDLRRSSTLDMSPTKQNISDMSSHNKPRSAQSNSMERGVSESSIAPLHRYSDGSLASTPMKIKSAQSDTSKKKSNFLTVNPRSHDNSRRNSQSARYRTQSQQITNETNTMEQGIELFRQKQFNYDTNEIDNINTTRLHHSQSVVDNYNSNNNNKNDNKNTKPKPVRRDSQGFTYMNEMLAAFAPKPIGLPMNTRSSLGLNNPQSIHLQTFMSNSSMLLKPSNNSSDMSSSSTSSSSTSNEYSSNKSRQQFGSKSTSKHERNKKEKKQNTNTNQINLEFNINNNNSNNLYQNILNDKNFKQAKLQNEINRVSRQATNTNSIDIQNVISANVKQKYLEDLKFKNYQKSRKRRESLRKFKSLSINVKDLHLSNNNTAEINRSNITSSTSTFNINNEDLGVDENGISLALLKQTLPQRFSRLHTKPLLAQENYVPPVQQHSDDDNQDPVYNIDELIDLDDKPQITPSKSENKEDNNDKNQNV